MKRYQQYISPYLKRYYKSILLAIMFSVLTIIASAMLTFTAGYLITKASLRPENILLLYIPIVGVRTFGISRAAFQYFERLAGHNAVLKILNTMRVQLYQMIEPQALFIHERFKTGDLLGTLADDIEHLQDVYIRTIFPTISVLVVFFISNLTLAIFDWKFTLWMVLAMGIIVFIYPIYSLYLLKMRQIKQKKWRTLLYENLTDTLFGLRDWVLSRNSKNFLKQFMADQKENNTIDRKINHWNQTRQFHLQVLIGFITITVAIWASQMAQSGEIAPAYIAAFTLITLPVLESMIPLSHAVERIPSYEESLKRLRQIDQYNFAPNKDRNETILCKEATIDWQDVHYTYRNQKSEAINGITLHIPHGQKIAILGRSGAGKSTLMKLLQGAIIPTSGSIRINNHSPQDYGESIYEMISVLNQKPYLFSTTVENNILLGNEEASKNDVEKVIQQVGLDKYIHGLPNGLQTPMQETGQRFSGGERQRIALARILLKDTPIVILDEPTIGLDPITEVQLIETIMEALKEKTVIWITHHLMEIEKMDKVIFMENGTITLNGTHTELMKDNKRYQQLYILDQG